MVKVQKLKPKSIKKDNSGRVKKPQTKKTTANTRKEVKEFEKTDENIQKKKLVKQKNDGLNKQSRPVVDNVKVDVKKGKQIRKVAQEEVKNDVQKKKSVAAIPKKAKTISQKNTSHVSKVAKKNLQVQNIIKNDEKENVHIDLKAVKKNKISPQFESVDFDEKKFHDILSIENIRKVSKALKVLVEKEVSGSKTSIFSDYRYYLNVACYKIPNCPKRIVKLNLKHSLVDTNVDDVVMIVPDLQRGGKVDYEPTIRHYQDILREIGEDKINIVPFNQLRNEYSSYEAKRKFANTYDYFLCDGRIAGHVVGFCGKPFQKPRTTIHAYCVKKNQNFKNEIERALKRTSYRQIQKGNMFSIGIGNERFTENQLAENIQEVIAQLRTMFPGGHANIRNIYIKIDIKGTSALPLYVNLSGAPSEVPNVIGPREQRMIKLKKQANDILTKFSVGKGGEFVKLDRKQVKRKREILEARSLVLSKDNSTEDENKKGKSSKKLKKDTKYKPQINEDNENEDDSEQENSDASAEEE